MRVFYMNEPWLGKVWERAKGDEARFARALCRAYAEHGGAEVLVAGPDEGGDFEIVKRNRRRFTRREFLQIARAQCGYATAEGLCG
jgi:hypothetical protein